MERILNSSALYGNILNPPYLPYTGNTATLFRKTVLRGVQVIASVVVTEVNPLLVSAVSMTTMELKQELSDVQDLY